MIRHFFIIFLFAFCTGLFAQKPVTKAPDSTARKPVNRAVVRSSQKPDSLKEKRILRIWNLSPDFSEEVSKPIDTVFSLFNRFKIADKYSPVNATLGNYGLPFYQISFFDRITDPDEFLYSTFYPLLFVPGKAIFMNTQVPFTELMWTFGGKREVAEQTFRVWHSQNVNRFLNFGLIYDIIYNLGQYNYQRVDDRNFNFYTSYVKTRYKLYASIGINNFTNQENGGITDLSELGKSTRDIAVNLGGLNNATSVLKNRNFLLVQRYTMGGDKPVKTDTLTGKSSGYTGLTGTFSHILVIDNSRRRYTDNDPGSGFYDSIFINRSETSDSLSSRSVKNTVRFDFSTDPKRKFRLGGGFGFRNEIFRYGQIIPTHDTLHVADTARWNRSNNVLVGKLFNRIGEKFGWTATGELYITGYRAGDFNLDGVISKSFDLKKGQASWLITGDIINRQPSFWFSQWGSNNFEWNVSLKKEFRIDVGTTISYPRRAMDIRFNYAVIKNYTDFDSTAHPSQYSGGLSVVSLTVKKGMRAWKFHLDTDLILQKSSNINILDLPLATIRSAGYFEHLFKFKNTGGKLNVQIGVDVIYNTMYHPYSYMPATGRFYRQDVIETGNYPFVNAFLNLKLERTRIFVMIDHLNYGLMSPTVVNNYDMIPNYPMNIRMFRFGVAWTFYN